MKEHAKKALKHDTKVLGKTVPTMLIIGLFLVGGGSAALLSTFGTVKGEADVQQAIELQSDSNFAFNGAQTAGETVVETRTLQSNANVTTEIGFETTCSNSSDYSATVEGVEADWGTTSTVDGDTSGCTGIDTRYVEYFDDAGHDFSDYGDSVPDEGTTVSSFSELNDEASDGESETIIVSNDDYTGNGAVTVTDQDTIIAQSQAGASVDGFIVDAEAEVRGFEVTGFETNAGDGTGIRVASDGAEISHNTVSGIDESSDTRHGIHVFDANNVKINYNLVDGVTNTDGGGAYGILVQADSDSVDVSYNTIRNVESQNGWAGAVSSSPSNTQGVTGTPNSLEVKFNEFGTVTGSSLYPGVCYYNDFSSEGDTSSNTISSNNFNGCPVDLENKDPDKTMDGSNNWFGTDGIVLDKADGEIDASWKQKSDTSIEAETTDKFGVVNEFAINLAPADYRLATSITPAGVEETPG